jgi:two-component system, OmpR family, KDP operon response regulator KdpE
MTRVLIVDDDPELLRALSINLRARKYEVVLATDGAAGLRQASSTLPDLVILDLGLPDMNGTEVIAGLRGWSKVPIVVLSAREGQADKVDALDAGADDYLTKPFGMNELLARVRAALRRAQPSQDIPVITTPHFTIDLATKRVLRNNQEVRLTPTEWHLLEMLVRHPGKLVGRRQLLTEIWGPTAANETNYLRVYIAQLRRKLEPTPSKPQHLITEPGIGYRFEP